MAEEIAKTLEPPPARETLAGTEGGAIDRLKGLTQRLKAATQEIPAQAILHQTGIIASQTAASESQAQAAKSKTMRISLSEALGAAPTKEEASPSPMKTIRIKRPVDLPRTVGGGAEVGGQGAAEVGGQGTPPPTHAAAAPTMTQRRTLRIARPTNLKTGSHLKLARPGATATQSAPKLAVAPETSATPEVADIPEMPAAVAPAAPAAQSADAPAFVTVLSIIVQIAACAIMGFVGWSLYQTCTLLAQ